MVTCLLIELVERSREAPAEPQLSACAHPRLSRSAGTTTPGFCLRDPEQ